MSAYMVEEDEVCFVFQEDEESKHSASQLKDLQIGDTFFFMGKKFTKRSDLGWMLGISNIVDEEGNVSHLHPTTRISVLH
jgi:hypothetical protein